MRPTANKLRWLWRSVATTLLLLLFAVMAVPIAAAQGNADDSMPPCCRAAGLHGCSMRMHRAAQHNDHTRELAAFTERCPCPPFAPAAAATHDAGFAVASRMEFALLAAAPPQAPVVAYQRDVFASDGDPRGPPSTLLA